MKCKNHKDLVGIRAAVQRENAVAGYAKYDENLSVELCVECQQYPNLMPYRICFVELKEV